MTALAWFALAVFAIAILLVITNVVDGTAAALLGVAVMVWFGVITEVDAFQLVDWNVMAILVSIWVIAGYFGEDGRSELALGAGLAPVRRSTRPVGDNPVGAIGRDLDVRRQRCRHTDDGAGGVAAGPRVETAGDAGRADDRLQCKFHGYRAVVGRSAAADDA